MPNIKAKNHMFMSGKNMKAGRYPDVDWNTITPLDEELVESMRDCESLFMNMIKRFSPEDIPYEERKRQYFRHLRFWNHIIETTHIDMFLSSHVPHQIYDIVIFDLCRHKNIPTLLLERCYIFDHFFMIEHWEDSAKELKPRIEELQKEYADPQVHVPLSEKMEHYIVSQTERDETPWFVVGRSKNLTRRSFILKWAGIGMQMLIRKPFQLLSHITKPKFWLRKIREHRIISLYDSHTTEPDFSASYIYFALQMQPEMSSCPMAGVFNDQELAVQLLAWHLPENTYIYIKEHPEQREWFRSKEFYNALLSIPNVRLMPRDTDTFQLIENAAAVMTGTGTVGMEALLRGIPVLMTGHRFYQYAPDIHMIRTQEDCKKAVESIFERKEKPRMQQVRIFLKAVEELAGETEIGSPPGPYLTYTLEEQLHIIGRYIDKRIRETMHDKAPASGALPHTPS